MTYREKLLETNISQSVHQFILSRIASDVDIPLRCSLTKTIVKVPIRHRMLNSINCVFELEEWILFHRTKGNDQLTECPGCRGKVKWEFYGIDYQLLNVISLMKFKDPKQTLFRQDKLRFQSRRNLYYAFSKNDPKQLIKLPGGREIINPKLQLSSNSPINEQLTQSLIKFQQIMVWKKIQIIEKKQRMDLNEANVKLSKVVPKVEAMYRKYNKLIEIGKESLRNNNEFVFTLRQIYKKHQRYSVLVVYYPCQNVWLDFDLVKPDGTPYVQLDGVLYIKDVSQQNQNVIYIAGGNITRYNQTNEFYKIVFPKDPMTDVKELKMERLPNLVKAGYNFMGTIYKGKIYLFYGQRRTINESTAQVTDELLSNAYVFKNNIWQDLNIKLLPRFDGSYFIIDHPQEKRCVFFYGGVPKNLDGLVPFAAQGVEMGQIFQCEKEQLLGEAQEITFPFSKERPENKLKQKNVINSPIFSIPYCNEQQLLISGQYMKESFYGKRQIFTYNWAANHIFLNEVLSMAPPEQILTPEIRKDGIIFTPVVDQMGTMYHNIFYTIYQYEDQNMETITELLKVNLATGEFLISPFQNREQCQLEFSKFYQGLAQEKDRIIV